MCGDNPLSFNIQYFHSEYLWFGKKRSFLWSLCAKTFAFAATFLKKDVFRHLYWLKLQDLAKTTGAIWFDSTQKYLHSKFNLQNVPRSVINMDKLWINMFNFLYHYFYWIVRAAKKYNYFPLPAQLIFGGKQDWGGNVYPSNTLCWFKA